MAEVEGLAALARKLDALSENADDALADAGVMGMMVVEGATKEKCPVLTGTLRRSYTTEVTEKSRENVVVATGTNVQYAPPVEHGTSRMPAQPHLRPAFDENQQKVIRVISAEIQKAIKEAVR